MSDYYRLGEVDKPKRRGRWIVRLIILIIIILLLIWGGLFIKAHLKPDTRITQGKPTITKVDSDQKTKHYVEPDFTIDIPTDWAVVPRPEGPYQTFTWATSNKGTDGQQIQVFEDTIPVNFASNRALIVAGEPGQLRLVSAVSDNCNTFTNDNGGTKNQFGTPAKWQDVAFLCDRSNLERNIVGTSSTDGVNMVVVKSENSGVSHKFFFTYTTASINPSYDVFTAALQSFRMQ